MPLLQTCLAALSNFATDPRIRDKIIEGGLLIRVSDLFEIYADVETIQLDLIFFVRNCLRTEPSIGQITLNRLPQILPAIRALTNSLKSLTNQLPFEYNSQSNWKEEQVVEGLAMILDSLLLLTMPVNFLLYQDLASQNELHDILSRIVETYCSNSEADPVLLCLCL